MDSLDKRKVEMTIEVKCIGLDEALEKTSKLVELLKEVEEREKQIDLLGSSKFPITMNPQGLAQIICDRDQEA